MFFGVNINFMFRVLIGVMCVMFIIACIARATKFILIGVVAIALLVVCNVITLDSVKEVGAELLDKVAEASETVSQYVKVDKENCEVYFNLDGRWIASEDLGSVKKDAGTYAIEYDGKSYHVDDNNLTKVIDLMYPDAEEGGN